MDVSYWPKSAMTVVLARFSSFLKFLFHRGKSIQLTRGSRRMTGTISSRSVTCPIKADVQPYEYCRGFRQLASVIARLNDVDE